MARILHVDDDEAWRRLVIKRLGDHHVDSAASLQQAIALLQSDAAYDVALVDLNLTDDNDHQGGDLLDLMHLRYPFTRRILVTGNPPAGSMRTNLFERYGVDEIIVKSQLSTSSLGTAVEAAIAQGLREQLTLREQELDLLHAVDLYML